MVLNQPSHQRANSHKSVVTKVTVDKFSADRQGIDRRESAEHNMKPTPIIDLTNEPTDTCYMFSRQYRNTIPLCRYDPVGYPFAIQTHDGSELRGNCQRGYRREL